MSLNNTLTNDNVRGLYPVNVNAVLNNVKTYAQGNRNTSPVITSPRLNNLPSIGNMPNENVYNVPPRVPKLKMPPPIPVKNNKSNKNNKKNKNSNNGSSPAPKKLKQNRKTSKNRKSRKNRKTRRN